jgi:hypothetical protein
MSKRKCQYDFDGSPQFQAEYAGIGKDFGEPTQIDRV